MCYNNAQFVYLQIEKGEEFMFHYFLQLNFATILISSFMLIFVNVNPVFQRKVIWLFSIAISSVLCLVVVDSIDTGVRHFRIRQCCVWQYLLLGMRLDQSIYAL